MPNVTKKDFKYLKKGYEIFENLKWILCKKGWETLSHQD